MNNNNNEKLTKRQRIEERVKFFLTNKNRIFLNQDQYKSENIKEIEEEDQQYISTIKIYQKYKNSRYREKEDSLVPKKCLQYSNNNINEETIKCTASIFFNKSIAKHIEQRFKIIEFQKLAPKFLKSAENSCSVSIFFNNKDMNTNDFEMLEIDEKLPQEKLNQIEERRNKLNIYKNFPFNYFFEQEKCYQELSKDFKSNGTKNLDYKLKIAATYLNILMKEDNPVTTLFMYKKEINKFLIIEL